MRGDDLLQSALFSYVSLEDRVPKDHPLRTIRKMADAVLLRLSPRFDKLYSHLGRPSIPPEQLVRGLLLEILFTIPGDRMLMEQLDYNLLFRWFVGLNVDQKVWDASTYSQNRERFLDGDVAREFFQQVLDQARQQGLLSDEHFTVDGTLMEAWASKKSFHQKDQPPEQGSGRGGKKLLRDTHESQTDPDARMYRKSLGGEFKLCHMGHVLMENRNGLAVEAQVTEATTQSERQAALEMVAAVNRDRRRVTVGADKAYDDAGYVAGLRKLNATPHVAQHTRRPTMIDGRTTRHPGYQISLRKRKRIEQIFGWLKTTGGMRKARQRGRRAVEWMFTLGLAAYNLVRMSRLLSGTA